MQTKKRSPLPWIRSEHFVSLLHLSNIFFCVSLFLNFCYPTFSFEKLLLGKMKKMRRLWWCRVRREAHDESFERLLKFISEFNSLTKCTKSWLFIVVSLLCSISPLFGTVNFFFLLLAHQQIRIKIESCCSLMLFVFSRYFSCRHPFTGFLFESTLVHFFCFFLFLFSTLRLMVCVLLK